MVLRQQVVCVGSRVCSLCVLLSCRLGTPPWSDWQYRAHFKPGPVLHFDRVRHSPHTHTHTAPHTTTTTTTNARVPSLHRCSVCLVARFVCCCVTDCAVALTSVLLVGPQLPSDVGAGTAWGRGSNGCGLCQFPYLCRLSQVCHRNQRVVRLLSRCCYAPLWWCRCCAYSVVTGHVSHHDVCHAPAAMPS